MVQCLRECVCYVQQHTRYSHHHTISCYADTIMFLMLLQLCYCCTQVYIPIQCSPKAAAPSISVSHIELQPVVVGESVRAVIKVTNSGALPCSYSIAPAAAAAANEAQQQQQQQQAHSAESSDTLDDVGAAVPLIADSSEVSQSMHA
jgi:hypothetical protein